MASRDVTCPSGLSGRVRGLKVREANMLADAEAQKKGSVFDSILDACWQSTVEPGPYELTPDGRPSWPRVLVCDRLVAMVGIRVATYGSEYSFGVQCQNRPACGAK